MRVFVKISGCVEDIVPCERLRALLASGQVVALDKPVERTAPVEVATAAPAEQAVVAYKMGPRSILRRLGFAR